MKKLYALAAGLFFSAAAFAQNHNVTFQVDLGSTAASANGVHVAGSFQGWTPNATTMTQVGTSSVYAVTVQIAAGDYEYKFINGNDWPDVEGVPSESQAGTVLGASNDNRWVVISSDTTLPAVMFGGNAPAGHNLMLAHVDLSLQTVAADGGKIAGDFNGWTDTDLANFGNDGTWETHLFIPDTDPAQGFKYKNGASGWETVPSACANGGGNREFANTGSAAMTTCFNLCGPCVTVPSYELTINVDLSSLSACQTIDAVTLAGPINGWSGSDTLTDPDGDGIYSIFFPSIDSGNFEYKARWHDASGATNWEGGGNKVVTLSADTILPSRCFGNDAYGACAAVPATADVTFIVDFTQASFTPADTIWLMGNFTQWDGNAIAMVPHTVGGQYITTVANFCPANMEYRFSNGDATDAANHEPVDSACGVDNGVGGYNRYFERTGGMDTLRHTFGTCSFVNVLESDLEAVAIYPNPMSQTAVIALGTADMYNVRIMDVTGRVVAGFNGVNGKVELARTNMQSGLYFVNIANSRGDVRTMKLMVE